MEDNYDYEQQQRDERLKMQLRQRHMAQEAAIVRAKFLAENHGVSVSEALRAMEFAAGVDDRQLLAKLDDIVDAIGNVSVTVNAMGEMQAK